VVCLASLTWRKAHPVLLEAAGAVARAQPGFKLVLMGEGPERPLVERLVKELGLARNVVLAGSVAQAPRLLRHFRFSVLSSSEESFPNALVESMAAGLAIVATRVGGIPELVRDGVDGRLVPPGDPQALAEAMLELWERPELAAGMGRSARQRASELFSVERMAGNFEDLYLHLVAEPAAAAPGR
jgi:glycosyltransferase involved in cell wall biosynthesis